jgi:hypothetical protein
MKEEKLEVVPATRRTVTAPSRLRGPTDGAGPAPGPRLVDRTGLRGHTAPRLQQSPAKDRRFCRLWWDLPHTTTYPFDPKSN